MRIREISDEKELAEIYGKLGSRADEVFWHEDMDEDTFVRVFSLGSYLYECRGEDGKEIGIFFVFAENRWAVKMGCASYSGRAKMKDIKEVFLRISGELAGRGVKVIVAEVPSGKKALRKILPILGFSMSGIIRNYFGEEGLIIFSHQCEK